MAPPTLVRRARSRIRNRRRSNRRDTNFIGDKRVVALGLLIGAGTFAYGGFESTSAHSFLAVLSYATAIGCAVGALVVGIVAPTKSAAKRENVGTTITPQYLVNLFKGRTEIQSQNLVKEHLGREMRVSGKIRSIKPMVSFSKLRMTIEHEPVVLAYFDNTWTERLTALVTGDQVYVSGKVDSVTDTVVSLEKCKIVSMHLVRHR